MKRAFVIGHPIAHSRSPLIHGYWLKRHGIEGSYERIDVAPADLARFLQSMAENGFVGGNVTIPHKQAVMSLCRDVGSEARAIGAVNTLVQSDGVLVGYNTDSAGFLSNLDHRVPGWDLESSDRSALVLGAGGAARAIVYALSERGFKIAIVNRTVESAQALAIAVGENAAAHRWGEIPRLLASTTLLVNTTSLGMKGQPPLEIDLGVLPQSAIVNDLVYVPLETALLRVARASGLRTVDGLGMLLHQAVPGFEHWFGIRPEVTDELYQLIATDIAGV